MMLGFNTVPAHFEQVMMTILDAEQGCPDHATYLDDVALRAPNVLTNWQDVLPALQCLIRIGFPISS